VEVASIARRNPHLQGVFGPLDRIEVAKLREILSRVDTELMQLAHHFGRDRAGIEGTGLELRLLASGQVFIASEVETGDRDSYAAAFLLELWPSWSQEEPSQTVEWIIEANIDVDCRHEPDHGSRETVWDRGRRRASSPETAVQELLRAATDFAAQGIQHPVEFWTSKTKS